MIAVIHNLKTAAFCIEFSVAMHCLIQVWRRGKFAILLMIFLL